MPDSAKNTANPQGTADIADLVLELVDHLDAMVAYWDAGQICRFANQAYKDWFGRGRDELLGTMRIPCDRGHRSAVMADSIPP
ncbi:PAS domain-containing protein [Pelomonas sp. P7]|uniref:PAS domain-containing protein n=1 Tax=Pelomonas caseinilytica TaxID=2906763 RepID=A0ABS8XIF4_9BURK|nr:PAS domain-containing protein [Pelomonas sp. P7]MCE4540626.1 PAS domain-containing protein [Pelomonas sp. P7]